VGADGKQGIFTLHGLIKWGYYRTGLEHLTYPNGGAFNYQFGPLNLMASRDAWWNIN